MKRSDLDKNVLSLWLSRLATENPDKIAIIHNNKRITNFHLNDSVERMSGALISLGVGQGDRVVILLHNSAEFVISFFSIARIGAIAVPLNVKYKVQELTDYLEDSKPKVIIALNQMNSLLNKVVSKTGIRDCTIISVPDNGKDKTSSYIHMVKETPPFNRSVELSSEDNVLCQYSSGSTGKPKRIVRTHFNLVSEAVNFCSSLNMTSNDKILCVVPLFHAHGLGNCMLASVYSGASLIILEDFDRHRVLKTIQEEQITVFPGVPFMFSILADTPLREKVNFSSLRLCFSAGAPLTPDTFQKFFEKYVVFVRQLYGSTETGSVTINMDDNIQDTSDSVGIPVRNVEVDIIGEKGEILSQDELGKIGIKSPAMIKDYAEMGDLNKESFRNGYFFPGDLGKKDNNGNLYIKGRKTLFLNTGGNKVDPSEIESLLESHPKVKEVVVVGIKSHYGDDAIKAVVVPECNCEESEIIDFCKDKIADFKIPRIIEFRKEIPKSPLNKILRKYLY